MIKKIYIAALFALSLGILGTPLAAANAAEAAKLVTGKALETMEAAPYSYVLMDTGSEKRWVAGPANKINVGDEIQTDAGMPMHEFHSKSLDRDFDVIYFVSNIRNVTAGDSPAAAKSAAVRPSSKRAAAPTDVKVEALKDGENIAALFADKEKYAGKEVKLRATVVKFNRAIMEKNWVHLQDGSGEASSKTNDLTVTTDAIVAVGDVVIASGTVTLDKDFGAGYLYPVILEEGKFEADK